MEFSKTKFEILSQKGLIKFIFPFGSNPKKKSKNGNQILLIIFSLEFISVFSVALFRFFSIFALLKIVILKSKMKETCQSRGEDRLLILGQIPWLSSLPSFFRLALVDSTGPAPAGQRQMCCKNKIKKSIFTS